MRCAGSISRFRCILVAVALAILPGVVSYNVMARPEGDPPLKCKAQIWSRPNGLNCQLNWFDYFCPGPFCGACEEGTHWVQTEHCGTVQVHYFNNWECCSAGSEP